MKGMLILFLVGLLALPARGTAVTVDRPTVDLPAMTVDLPWTKFSETVKDAAGAGLGMCLAGEAEKEVFSVRLIHGKNAYHYWAEAEGTRMVWVVWIGNVEGALPDAVGFGTGDPNSTDLIPSIRWEKFDPSVHKTPCDFLFPPGV